jgi:hypothetical protein
MITMRLLFVAILDFGCIGLPTLPFRPGLGEFVLVFAGQSGSHFLSFVRIRHRSGGNAQQRPVAGGCSGGHSEADGTKGKCGGLIAGVQVRCL